MASSSLGTLHVKVCSITVSGQSLKKRKAEIADNETSLYCLLFVAGGFAKVPSRPMELATWDQDMTFYLQQSFEFPLGATRSTLTLSIFYESCCEDNKWAQIVANIGHLPHNKTEEACFNVEEGVNNSKITASFSLELRFVSADAAKNATPTNAVRLKASGDFTKRDKGDLERLHADSKVSSSKKKAKKKASGFGQIFHKKRNRSRAFGQQFPPDEPVVPEIITSTVEWLRQSASKTHGLFRESASTADMDMLRKQWESGKDVSWDEVPSPHVVAGLLMTWLLQLPEPLITFDLYESLIAAEETVASRDSRVQFLARVLASLPVAHRMSLACIIEFVHFLSLNSEFNKMTSKNLAIVFGPALMRRRVENVKQIVQDSPIIVNIVQCMIEEYEPIFKGAARPAAGGTAGGPTPLSAKVPLEAFLSRKHTWRKSLAGNIRPNEGMVTSILHNRDKLVAFQAMVRSSLSNVQDSIQYLGKELEDSSRWSQPDVEFCGSLWANLNTLVNSPFERPDGWLTSTPPDEFRTGESDEARATTCKALRSAFLELENSFTEIYERISVSMESQDAPDQTAVEFAVAASNIARIAKRLLEQFQDIVLNDMQFSLPVQSATSTHETQLTLEQMQHSVNSTIDEIQAIKLPGLRKALATVTSLQDAVAITRVLRATKNALEQRSREPLAEFVAKVRSPVPMTDLEREKLASIIELLEEPFDEVGQLLEQLRSDVSALQDVYDTVEPEQLLVDIRRFLDEYLTQCQSKPVAATPEAERPGWRAPRPMGGNRAFGGFLRPTASAGARPTSPLLGSHHLPAASAAASSEDAEVAAATAVASNALPPVTPLPPVATSPPPLSAVSPPPDATPEQPDNDEDDDDDDDEEYDDSDEFDDDDDDDDEEEEEPAVQTTLQKAVQTALAAVQQIRDRANSLRMDIETIKTLEGALAISKLASAIKRAAAGDMDNISNVTKRPNEADCSPATQTDQLKVNTILRLATSGFDEVRGMTFIWQTQLKEAVSREDIIPIAQKLKRIYELMSIYLAA